jgi:hypothetical protein
MSDYTELKRLAEAAPEGPWFGPEYAPGTSYVFDVDLGSLLHYESIDTEQDACLRYVAAANPAAVLGLIAENERMHSAAETLERIGYTDHGGELWKPKIGKAPDFNVIDHLKAENEALRRQAETAQRGAGQLKAENEALRKNAERYQRLRDKSEAVHQFYLSVPLWFTGVRFRSQDVDNAIDAMSKGEQS